MESMSAQTSQMRILNSVIIGTAQQAGGNVVIINV